MMQNDLTSQNDTQELLYDTVDIAPSKKTCKEYNAFKNTQTNELIKEVTNALKNLNKVKTQHSSSKTADDMFCEMTAVHLKDMNERPAKEFLKLDIHIAVITAIHYNNRPQNTTVQVPQFGNSASLAGVNFISPTMTPAVPHINHTNFGCGQK